MMTLKLLPGEMFPSPKPHAKIYLPAPAFPVPVPGAPRLTRTRSVAHVAPLRSEGFLQDGSSASAPRTATAALIYLVDDEEGLTELYTHFLKGTGYLVRAFSRRAEALAALTADRNKPDLLITDYCGLSIPVERFMHQCLAVHPTLRILMASGFGQASVQFSRVGPDRFIQKPFTAAEFLQEVGAALAA